MYKVKFYIFETKIYNRKPKTLKFFAKHEFCMIALSPYPINRYQQKLSRYLSDHPIQRIKQFAVQFRLASIYYPQFSTDSIKLRERERHLRWKLRSPIHTEETKGARIQERGFLPGRSAVLRVRSMSFRAWRLRISTFTLALLSIFTYGFFFDFFFNDRTFDLITSTKFSSWFAISRTKSALFSLQLGQRWWFDRNF